MSRKAVVCLVSLGVILAVSHVSAQRAFLAVLKAAYLLNFMKFIEWPADRPRPSPVVLCVVGDHELLKILQQMAKGRTLGGYRHEEPASPTTCITLSRNLPS